jgi:hypothetical protein
MLMKSSTLKALAVILVSLSAQSCAEKQETNNLSNLAMLYATPIEKGTMPLTIYTDSGKLSVRYVENGKTLDPVRLELTADAKTTPWQGHAEGDGRTGGAHGVTYDYLCFDEMIGGEKHGQYHIPRVAFDTLDHIDLWQDRFRLFYVNGEGKSSVYHIAWTLSTNDVISESKLPYRDNYGIDHTEDEALVYRLLRAVYLERKECVDLLEPPHGVAISPDGNLQIYNVGDLFNPYYPPADVPMAVIPRPTADYSYNGYPHCFDIVQFKSDSVISSFGRLDDLDPRNVMPHYYSHVGRSRVAEIRTDDGATLYIVTREYYTDSSEEFYDSADKESGSFTNANELGVYAIENGELVRKRLIDTGSLLTDHVTIEYDNERIIRKPASWDEDGDPFVVDADSRAFYVPLVEKVTLVADKYLRYQWDGDRFAYRGMVGWADARRR